MRKSTLRLLALAATVVTVTNTLRAQEVVPKDKLPRAVTAALLARFPKALVAKATRETENKQVVYDLEFTQDGHKFEADITASGTFVNYEKAIDAKELPKAVSDAAKRLHPAATLKEVMEETGVKGKTEAISAYEVLFAAAGKKDWEVRFTPAGKVIDAAEEKKGEKP